MRTIDPCHVKACLAVCLITVCAWAGEPFQARGPVRQKLIERFDKDGDGRLSASERAELRQALAGFEGRDAGGPQPQRLTWTIDGVQREALVYLPTRTSESGSPVVFGFHGHGGSARNVARKFAFQRYWPEALVVYMQGLPTPGRLTDPEGKRTGWQHGAGDQNDRDLKFFDTVLSTLREKHKIDEDRVYATGHSNGGAFTYLLWAERPDALAAVAPSAAASRSIRSLTPKPAMHIAGRNDQLVKFVWQQRAMNIVRAINGCEQSGRDWAKDCTFYPSRKDAPFIAFIHSGDHKYPEEAPPLIVRFFKEHSRKHNAAKRPAIKRSEKATGANRRGDNHCESVERDSHEESKGYRQTSGWHSGIARCVRRRRTGGDRA